MSLIVKIAERAIEPIVNGTEEMLISGNPNLISPAPAAASFLPMLVFIGLAVAAVVGVAFWRHSRAKMPL